MPRGDWDRPSEAQMRVLRKLLEAPNGMALAAHLGRLATVRALHRYGLVGTEGHIVVDDGSVMVSITDAGRAALGGGK